MHVSACSFAVSQASDLALLVGYVAYEDFNFNFLTLFDVLQLNVNIKVRCTFALMFQNLLFSFLSSPLYSLCSKCKVHLEFGVGNAINVHLSIFTVHQR